MKLKKSNLEVVKSCVLKDNYDELKCIPKDFKTSIKLALWEFGYTLDDLKVEDTENIISNVIFAYCPSDFGLKDFKGDKACSSSCTLCWGSPLKI